MGQITLKITKKKPSNNWINYPNTINKNDLFIIISQINLTNNAKQAEIVSNFFKKNQTILGSHQKQLIK